MYTIKEASIRSGIGIPLLRAWERRYGVVTPLRTPSGYRLYDDAAIERLRAMRQLVADGWSAQQAAERIRRSSDAELAALTHQVVPAATGDVLAVAEGTDPLAVSTAGALISRYVDAARDIDAAALEGVLDEAFSSARFEVVADLVVMPALRSIGDAWERQVVTVAGEHAASHAVLRRLAMAYEAAGEPDGPHPILVGLGPGARHELGAFAFAIAARRAGLPVLYLGPDLPPDSWVAAVVGREARAAVIGTPTRADIRGTREVIDALRTARPELLIAIGGNEARRPARVSGALELPQSLLASLAALRSAL
jgi:MerR family transcriptional regulator, light-induced transcriptional regulator